jgi:hypothetical protein
VQKVHGADDIKRFREYLASAGYAPKDESAPLVPIITIYFLGFELENVPTPCLKVSRQYIDMLKNEVLDTKEKFVELLTHDSYVIQAPRIQTDPDLRTNLETILSIFMQGDFADENGYTVNYRHEIKKPFQKIMVDILSNIASNPEARKKMEEEAYWQKHEDRTTGEVLRLQDKLVQKDGVIAQKDGEIAKKNGVIAEQADALAQQAQEIENLKKQIERMKK